MFENNKINLDKLKDYIDSEDLREKPKYNTSEFVIYNNQYPYDDKEFLFFIQERVYKKWGNNFYEWYYSGVIFDPDEVMNKDISLNDLWATRLFNVLEKSMKPLESTLKKD